MTQTSSSTLVMLSRREFFSDSLSLSSSSMPAKATFLVPGDTPALLIDREQEVRPHRSNGAAKGLDLTRIFDVAGK